MSVEMLNGQLAKLPLNRPDDARHGGTEGSDLVPYRHEMLPPGQPGAFGTQRQIPRGGEIHVAQDASGYRMYPKRITPDHDGRQLPYEGDVPFNSVRLPTASYRTRAEAFKNVPYWSVKPVMGPDDWPSRKLFPSQPNMEVVDSIEHDVLPVPYTRDNRGGFSVMDMPGLDFDPDLQVGISGLGDFGGLGQIGADAATAVGVKAVADMAAANPEKAKDPSWVAALINGAVGILAPIVTKYVTPKPPKPPTPTPTGAPTTYIPGYTPEAPFYTQPLFLALAALGVVGGGYLILKK